MKMNYTDGKMVERILEQMEAQTELLLLLAKKAAPEEFKKPDKKEGE